MLAHRVSALNVHTAARGQYQRIIDDVGSRPLPSVPAEGWLRTVRKALRMSGAQLAMRMGVTRSRVAQAEQAELSGAATLKSMHAAAEALGCRFVYAVVPNESIEDSIAAQARKKAAAVVRTASTHMALEAQVLPDGKITQQIDRLARDIANEMPPDLWNDR